MFKKLSCLPIRVIRRMNEWWDKDEDKEVGSIIAGILILAGIIVLSKAALFIFALILITNRVLHRFNVWTSIECGVGSDEPVTSPIQTSESYDSSAFNDSESIVEHDPEKTQ